MPGHSEKQDVHQLNSDSIGYGVSPFIRSQEKRSRLAEAGAAALKASANQPAMTATQKIS